MIKRLALICISCIILQSIGVFGSILKNDNYETDNEYQVCLLPHTYNIHDCLLFHKDKYSIDTRGIIIIKLCDILYITNNYGTITKHEMESLVKINCDQKLMSVQLSPTENWTKWTSEHKLPYTKTIMDKICNLLHITLESEDK